MTFNIKSLLFWVIYLVKMLKVCKKKSCVIKIMCFLYKCCVSLCYKILKPNGSHPYVFNDKIKDYIRQTHPTGILTCIL